MIGSPHRTSRVRALVVALCWLTAVVATLGLAPAASAAAVGTFTGRVTGVDGKPLAGVVVTGVIPSPCDFFGCTGTTVGTTTSGTDGNYRLRVDGAGSSDVVRVQFSPAQATGGTSPTGYADQCYRGDDSCAYGTGRNFTHVPGRSFAGIDVALPRAGVLRGRVTDVLSRGVGGFAVYLYRGQPDRAPDGTYPTTTGRTDVNGNYRLPQLAAHPDYYVCFGNVPGGAHAGTPAVDGYASHCHADPVTVASGRVATVDQTVQGRGALSGTLVDQTGSPVAGATVSVYTSLDGSFPQTATSRNSGAFVVVGVNPGRVFAVCVVAPRADSSCDYPTPTVKSFTTADVGRLAVHVNS